MTPRFVVESARLAGAPLLRCQTDARLVDLVRSGNDRAFEAIVDRYRRPLLRYCARLLPPGRDEDALQQTFLNAYGAMQQGDAQLELRPWLYRIARNACLNALRENGWSHERIEKLRRGTESAHEVAERRSELREVVAAVHTLPARQREAVVLRELEGRTYDQIASELDSSEGAVRQLLNRARHTLRAGATALTPIAVLVRLTWAKSQPMVAQVSEAAGHEAVRSGAGRFGGAVAAAIALAAGVAEAPRYLFGDPDLHRALRDPESLPALRLSAPAAPGGVDPTSITLSTSTAVPKLSRVAPVARPVVPPATTTLRTGPGTPPTIAPVPVEQTRNRTDRDDGDATRGRRADVGHRRKGYEHQLGPRDVESRRRSRSGDPDEQPRADAARRTKAHSASIARHRRRPHDASKKPDARGRKHADRSEHRSDRPKKHGDRPKRDRRKGKRR